MTTATAEPTTTLEQATNVWLARHDRLAHPSGTFDKGGRFTPSAGEWQACCQWIRPPSRHWPFSLMLHCRSIEHVANLYGVDPTELRRAVRKERTA